MRPGRVPRTCLSGALLILGSVACADSAYAQFAMDDVSFMTGCWEGTFGSGDRSGIIEERYSTPSVNVLLGTTRYLREGRAVQFEFTLIEADGGRIALIPYPGGERSEHDFVLTTIEGFRAMFEAPEHDFPKRIIYDGTVAGQLTASIDGGADDGSGSAWTMRSVPCSPPTRDPPT